MPEIDEDYVKQRVAKSLEIQFEFYSWEQMIDDSNLTKEQADWAKENLTYQCVTVESLYAIPEKSND